MFAVNSFFSCVLFHSARRRQRAFTIDYFRNFETLTAINRKKTNIFFPLSERPTGPPPTINV